MFNTSSFLTKLMQRSFLTKRWKNTESANTKTKCMRVIRLFFTSRCINFCNTIFWKSILSRWLKNNLSPKAWTFISKFHQERNTIFCATQLSTMASRTLRFLKDGSNLLFLTTIGWYAMRCWTAISKISKQSTFMVRFRNLLSTEC